MKIIKPRYTLLFYFYLPFTILSCFIYFSFAPVLTITPYAHWLFDFLLIVLLFLPLSKKQFGSKNKLTFFKWFLGLFFIQFILNGLMLGSLETMIKQTDVPYFNIFEFSAKAGLYPWAYTTFFAITLGYLTYTLGKPGLFSSAFSPVFKNSHLDDIGVAVDSYMRSLTFFCVVFCVTLLTLTFILLWQFFFSFEITRGLNFIVVLINTILISIITQKWWNKFLSFLINKHISIANILVTFSFLLATFYIFLNQILIWLLSFYPYLILIFNTHNPRYASVDLQIIIIFWWFAFGVIAGAFSAYISQGRSIRQLILVSLVGNILSWILLGVIRNFTMVNTLQPLLLTLICPLVILYSTLNKKTITYLMRATLPTPSAIKTRSVHLFLRTIPLVSLSMLGLYFALDVYIWSFIAVFIMLPCMMIIFIGFVSFLKELLR